MQTTSSPTSSEPSSWSRSYLALGLWLGLAVGIIALAFIGASQEADERRDLLFETEFTAVSLVTAAFLVGLSFGIAAAFPSARAALGLRPFPLRWLWITLGLVVAALIVSSALEPILGAGEEQGLAPEEWHPDRAWVFAVNGVVVSLVVPFAEELFFRGLGVRVLAFGGAAVAVAGSALVFALAHGLLSAIPALGFFGLVLGWVRYRTESVWPGFIAHALYNGIGVLIALGFALSEDERVRALALLL